MGELPECVLRDGLDNLPHVSTGTFTAGCTALTARVCKLPLISYNGTRDILLARTRVLKFAASSGTPSPTMLNKVTLGLYSICNTASALMSNTCVL